MPMATPEDQNVSSGQASCPQVENKNIRSKYRTAKRCFDLFKETLTREYQDKEGYRRNAREKFSYLRAGKELDKEAMNACFGISRLPFLLVI